jgi:hypothetical protein
MSACRNWCVIATAGIAVVLSAQSASAQATYDYEGSPFTLFSCGPNGTNTAITLCSTPGPNANTSYILGDRVTATITVDAPLEANLALTSITGRAGFHLTLNDGRHTVSTPIGAGQGLVAEVATDASGNIVNWNVFINTGGLDNGGISTQHYQHPTISTCCHGDGGTLLGVVPGNLARVIANPNPGVWTTGGGTPTPTEAVTALISVVADPLLGLSAGQVTSLTDKLSNARASIDAGSNKQAVNQLKAFNNSVESAVKNGKMDPATGTLLTGEANEIIAMVQP